MNIVLIIIIGLNVLISFKGFNDSDFFNKFKFHVGAIKQGEQYRNITSAFLHADIQHLLFNMVGLYFFAPVIINMLGWLITRINDARYLNTNTNYLMRLRRSSWPDLKVLVRLSSCQ